MAGQDQPLVADIVGETYVEYCSLDSQSKKLEPVESRDTARDILAMPPKAYAFRYYDVLHTSVEVDGERINLESRRFNFSKQYFVDVDEVREADLPTYPGLNDFKRENLRFAIQQSPVGVLLHSRRDPDAWYAFKPDQHGRLASWRVSGTTPLPPV